MESYKKSSLSWFKIESQKKMPIILIIVGIIGAIVGCYYLIELMLGIISAGLGKAWVILIPAIALLMCGIGIFIVGLKSFLRISHNVEEKK